jgi:hypothetical protein
MHLSRKGAPQGLAIWGSRVFPFKLPSISPLTNIWYFVESASRAIARTVETGSRNSSGLVFRSDGRTLSV